MAPFANSEIVPLSEVPDYEPAHNLTQQEEKNSVAKPIVMVVDDEPLVADSLSAILKLAGYAVVTTYSALSALGLAISLRPALVISDVAMPKMNGIELAMSVVKSSPDCRILLFSGHATLLDLAPAREAGHDFTLLSKPVHPAEMLKHVTKSLSAHAQKSSRFLQSQLLATEPLAQTA